MEISKLIKLLQEAEQQEETKKQEESEKKSEIDYDKLASLIVEKTQQSNLTMNQSKTKTPDAESLEDKIRRLL